MRILFMGTPDFAAVSLKRLVEDGHDICGVFTQPDKPRNRNKVTFSPVKEYALSCGLNVYQPVKMRDGTALELVKTLAPELIVVVAYGRILPPDILAVPPLGCVNVHASLLPKYRGAAPIQWAVIDGEKETGVTTMRMDEGLDTGDMILKCVVPLDEKETGGSLFDKLSGAGADLLIETLRQLENGTAVFTKQDSSQSTYAGMIKKSLGQIDWRMEAARIECLIRGLNPWPSAYTKLGGKTLKIWSAEVTEEASAGHTPGEVVSADGALYVAAGDRILALTEVQLEGKKRMDTEAFLRGYEVLPGTVLGQEEA